jgi:glutamate-1-semialdehyde 2,1-aminomutase
LAAVVAEPIVANNGCLMPTPGYLELLREECTRRGLVLIFDEIVTGFRVAPGGAQELFGVVPDLTVLSKALGAGFPISAFGGAKKIMDPVAANTVKHGGTYNGSPLCATAALYSVTRLNEKESRDQMNRVGDALIEAIRKSAHDNGVKCVVQGLGSMFQVVFGFDRPLRHYRDSMKADTKKYAAFHNSLLMDGIHANSSGLACWFVSPAHTEEDVKVTVAAIEKAIVAVA